MEDEGRRRWACLDRWLYDRNEDEAGSRWSEWSNLMDDIGNERGGWVWCYNNFLLPLRPWAVDPGEHAKKQRFISLSISCFLHYTQDVMVYTTMVFDWPWLSALTLPNLTPKPYPDLVEHYLHTHTHTHFHTPFQHQCLRWPRRKLQNFPHLFGLLRSDHNHTLGNMVGMIRTCSLQRSKARECFVGR